MRANLGGENRGGGKLGGMVGNWDKKGALGRMALNFRRNGKMEILERQKFAFILSQTNKLF